jgi:hypothetical protein
LNIKTSTRLLKLFLSALFTCIICYFLLVYFTCQKELNRNTPIDYTIKEKKEHKGRGSSYTMSVLYKQKLYEVTITSRTFENVDNDKLPILFYNPTMDIVFEKWKLTQAKRAIGISSIMILLVVFLIKNPKNNYS